MSGQVREFASPQVVLASIKVHDFIELVRTQINVLIDHDQWDHNVWQVGHAFVTKSRNIDRRVLAFYNRQATVTRWHQVVGEPLHPSFIHFAKAYIRWMQSAKPFGFQPIRLRLEALQLIESSFRDLGVEPAIENLNVAVLNRAVEMAREGVGSHRHYQFAQNLARTHNFCLERGFLRNPFPWKPAVRSPTDKTLELGVVAKEWRANRLPSPEAFHALAHVFRNGVEFQDRLFSAVTAILMSVPLRAHEALQLRLDCEVRSEAKAPETCEMIQTYGLRVWPGKNEPPQVKWVPTHMITVVEEAVRRLVEMCTPAREVAAWYEKNPNELWLPNELLHCRRSGYVPLHDVGSVLGMTPRATANWLREHRLSSDRSGGVRLKDLTDAVLPMLPRDFPVFNGDQTQHYSETMIVLFRNQLSSRGTNPSVVMQATLDAFIAWLGSSDVKRRVFTRWGFTEKDGSPIRLGTHAFRHWLNTVAQLRGMSEIDIAKWSGRNIAQNKAYNHVTPEETLSQIREAMLNGRVVGPMFEAAQVQGINTPVDRREFLDAQIGSALITDFGICVHDYSLLPCQSHGDCLGCSENVFVKGDADHRAKVEKRLQLSENQLDQALRAVGEQDYGADRWVAAHTRGITRQKMMLAAHDDQSMPDGTIVNLPDGALDNEVAMALRDREALGITHGSGSETELDDLNEQDALTSMWED
ncbi:hypothetical protein GGR20_003340 [Devosia subaequoris]|uniref:Integrase n=1 Tax=Devosia subaequoris TaxID=395930 RepID=A0A7W6IQ16_9HYPH|nr:hypothetical protein [Devosia subaequoris]MBB4053678.1 hypothetical protein [Devosia subaequoris]MCP1211120.1 hypothetical protein [Devosia subaequoris]